MVMAITTEKAEPIYSFGCFLWLAVFLYSAQSCLWVWTFCFKVWDLSQECAGCGHGDIFLVLSIYAILLLINQTISTCVQSEHELHDAKPSLEHCFTMKSDLLLYIRDRWSVGVLTHNFLYPWPVKTFNQCTCWWRVTKRELFFSPH